MTKRYDNFPALTSDLAYTLIDALKADGIDSRFGLSGQSCSAYVEVHVYDADGDGIGEVKARFSDHADQHGSDFTMRIDNLVDTIEDDGEYIATEIEEYKFDKLVADAKAQVLSLIAEIRAEEAA
jgi:hypothetical protein